MIAANGVTARYSVGQEIPIHPSRGSYTEKMGADR